MYEGSSSKLDAKGNTMIECLKCFEEHKRQTGSDSDKNRRYMHQLATHLKTHHKMNVSEYQTEFPGAAIISEFTKSSLAAARAKTPAMASAAAKIKEEVKKAPASEEPFYIGVATLPFTRELPADRQILVPEHDESFEIDQEKLEILALGIQHNDNVLMVGPTGCGKTSLAYELAAIVNHPMIRINMNGDFRAADFVGEKHIDVDPETAQSIIVWKDGILPNAMRNGYWLLIDELDACPPAIAFVLQAVLEGKPLVISTNGGEVVKPAPGFRLIATANTIGKGDDTGMYTGTNVMNEAFLDRFGTVMQFAYPNEETEVKILVAKTKIDKLTATKMVEVATKVRGGVEKEECYCSFSTRRLIRWATKTVALRGGAVAGKHTAAAEITILNKLTKDDRKFVEAVLQRVMGK